MPAPSKPRVPSYYCIDIAGEAVPLRIVRNPRARRVTLRADAVKREVRIALPPRARMEEALRFASEQRDWIGRRLHAAPDGVSLCDGAMIALEGQQVTLRWDPAYRRTPQLVEGELQLGGASESVGPRALRFLKAEARRRMVIDAAFYAARAGVAAPQITLSDPRGRWGSCSSSGCIRLSWRLVMAPASVRRAVVAHEVAHLIHMNHSAHFYALLDAIYEGERTMADRWLKAHGLGLQMIGR